jgi:cbb3-type cytochrome oxidase cytochrome c subunit
MNKTNIPFISIVLLVSVVGLVLILRYESQYQKKKDTLPKEQPIELSGYKTYTLNGCEYITVGFGQYRWGSHKGDCKNPIHYTK